MADHDTEVSRKDEPAVSAELATSTEHAQRIPMQRDSGYATQRSEHESTAAAAHDEYAKAGSGSDQNRQVEGTEFTIGDKIADQMGPRGWTESSIKESIENPHRTVETADRRWNPETQQRNNDPATAYINSDDSYVVRNDVDGDIVQVSDRTDPNWRSPFA